MFDAHRGTVDRHAAGSGGRRRPHRLHARAGRLPAGTADAARSPRRRHSRRPPDIVVVSLWATGRASAEPRRAALPRRPDAAADPELDQRRRRPGPDRQPSAVRRRERRSTSTAATNTLWALNTADGKPKWSVPLDFLAQTPPSVSPDGLIVAGGGPDAKLVAIRDGGDHGDVVWTRDDVAPLTRHPAVRAAASPTPSPRTATTGRRCWCSIRPTATPSTATRCREATGWPVGVSVGHDRRVVTATSDGQVYGFAPE